MMHDEIVDILLRVGIPAGAKGFSYIHDALDLMDRDPYYFSGKVCALYAKVAKQHGANAAQVERAMRYAFEGALSKGRPELVAYYLDPINTQNSNQLKTLFLRWKQEAHQSAPPAASDDISETAYRAQIYQEVLVEISSLLSQLQHAPSSPLARALVN